MQRNKKIEMNVIANRQPKDHFCTTVQVSDTTMMLKEQMLVPKNVFGVY